MNQHQHRLLDVTHALTRLPSRRDVLRGLTATALGMGFRATDAKKRNKRKRNKNKNKNKNKNRKVKFNAFGCVNVGALCQNNEQCCSGICTGDTGQNSRRCQAHDTGGCQLADDTCVHEEAVLCPDDTGGATRAVRPFCFQTTGQAGFCGFQLTDQCVACTKDADCVAEFGAGAACVVCPWRCADSNHTTCIPTEFLP